ncbi:MAG: hypothetical protein H0U02_10955 [Rubrobacter sp.]|jgi:hypothetical protein|nr:hypothetical protein [Rubrobacter sp.]MBA3789759.1 hypothetical protein [Rubrobacter sp.]
MSPQTTPQILQSLSLGRYTVRVVDGELEIQGPQPPAGPLPASIKARRDELIAVLNEYCGGAWPPAPGSDFYGELVREERPKEPLKKPLTVEEQLEGEEF